MNAELAAMPRVWAQNPTGLEGYLRIVGRIQQAWTDASPDRIVPWFRGHADASWILVPGLYRPPAATIREEYQLRGEFRLRAYPYLSDATYVPHTEWDWYFLMQHYGLPTRLLDWTESALIGLYFAVRDQLDRIDGCVWMLDPWAVARCVAGMGDMLFDHLDPVVAAHLPRVWSPEPLPSYPLTVQPPFNSRRISAQRGMFTIHGSDTAPIETYDALAGALVKIVIKRRVKERIRDQLGTAGISELSVFPDLSGLCRELWSTYRPPA